MGMSCGGGLGEFQMIIFLQLSSLIQVSFLSFPLLSLRFTWLGYEEEEEEEEEVKDNDVEEEDGEEDNSEEVDGEKKNDEELENEKENEEDNIIEEEEELEDDQGEEKEEEGGQDGGIHFLEATGMVLGGGLLRISSLVSFPKPFKNLLGEAEGEFGRGVLTQEEARDHFIGYLRDHVWVDCEMLI